MCVELSKSCPVSEWVTIVAGGAIATKNYQVKMFRNGEVASLPDRPPGECHTLTVNTNKVRAWIGGFSMECHQLDPFEASPKWEKCKETRLMDLGAVVQVLDDVWVFAYRTIHVVPQIGNASEIEWPHDTLSTRSCVQTNGLSTIVIPDAARHVYINSDATSPQSWEHLATLPTRVMFRSCLLMESLLYVTGGWNGTRISKESYVIDIDSGNVRRLGDMLTALSFHAMGVIAGAPAVIGGIGQSITEILDTATGTWRASNATFGNYNKALSVSFAINKLSVGRIK